jgi:excisionase family DNA binding protein
MSIEHSPARQRHRTRKRTGVSLSRLAYTINEWCELTNQSRASVYRQMAAGTLRYVNLGDRNRRIPAEEGQRLGFVTS